MITAKKYNNVGEMKIWYLFSFFHLAGISCDYHKHRSLLYIHLNNVKQITQYNEDNCIIRIQTIAMHSVIIYFVFASWPFAYCYKQKQ